MTSAEPAETNGKAGERPLSSAILSIQSHVVYGHVGNSAAVFALQRLGREVWPIHTVQFSNHTGYGGWRGRVFAAGDIDECAAGLAERGVLGGCAGLLSGYIGSPDIGAAILRAASQARAANAQAIYCCDPVLGDRGRGFYVQDGVADFMRERAVPAATIVTPNHFELEALTGAEARTLGAARKALAKLHAAGPRIILVTSVELDDTPPQSLDLLASGGGAIWRLRTPKAPVAVNGAGDVIAALFLHHWLERRDAAAALARAASAVYGLVAATQAAGSRELALIPAQDQLVNPSRLFAPERV
ncbi:MAG TPA: pyridoxal kinase PdxY [Roseiarcus sp.]|nr:pyridoxal kinase PdxY [Roseiarcus sp.]